ncbi:hypothetical protein ACQJBY_034741 [Aegilops geniculata]
MAIGIPPLNKWSSKHLVVAGSTGTLVVITIAAVIIISLAPPQVLFSIQDARLLDGRYKEQKFYIFSLSANNTSRRMQAHYTNVDAVIWIDPTKWYPAEVNMSGFQFQQYVQPPRNVTKVPWRAQWAQYDNPTDGSGGSAGHWPNCTVVVMAKVWFKVGLARTRPYHIRVSCFPVNFINQTQTPYTDCTY